MPHFVRYDTTTGDVTGTLYSSAMPIAPANAAFLAVQEAQAHAVGSAQLLPDGGGAAWRVVNDVLSPKIDTRPILTITISPAEADDNDLVSIAFQARNSAGAVITPTAQRKLGVIHNGALRHHKVSLVAGEQSISRTFPPGAYEIVSVDPSFRIEGDRKFIIYEAF